MPKVQTQPTPEGHEYGEEHCGLVVEEVHDLGVEARLAQAPVVAEVVASRADHHIVSLADVLTTHKIYKTFSKTCGFFTLKFGDKNIRF